MVLKLSQNPTYSYHFIQEVKTCFEDIYDISPRDIVRGIISPRFGWTQDYVDSMHYAWDKFRKDAITDLVRNDLSVNAKRGSVKVEDNSGALQNLRTKTPNGIFLRHT